MTLVVIDPVLNRKLEIHFYVCFNSIFYQLCANQGLHIHESVYKYVQTLGTYAVDDIIEVFF